MTNTILLAEQRDGSRAGTLKLIVDVKSVWFLVGLAGSVSISACSVPLGTADFCNEDADCDNGIYCDGAESCLFAFCITGPPPCEGPLSSESCDEREQACIDPCAVTSSECVIDGQADYQTTLGSGDGFPDCLDFEAVLGWRVGGLCEDGTLFVSSSDSLHEMVRFFEAGTAALRAWMFQSDSIDCECAGLSYCPARYECNEARVTDVICGSRFEVGDAIHLPSRRVELDRSFWRPAANETS